MTTPIAGTPQLPAPQDEIVTYHPVCDPSADYDYECDCPTCQPLSEPEAAEISEAYPLPSTLSDEDEPIADSGPKPDLQTSDRREIRPTAEPCVHGNGPFCRACEIDRFIAGRKARAATQPVTPSLAQCAVTSAEAAARNAEGASRYYAETLLHGYANGIVPHQATTLAQRAADLATLSASTMRQAMAAAAAENAQVETPPHQ